LNYPFIVDQFEMMTITARMKNTGSIGISDRIEIYILIENATNILHSFNDRYVTLLPGESRVFTTTYAPYNSSFHWIHAVPTYGNVAEAWGIFYVTPYAEILPEIPPGPPGAPIITFEEEFGFSNITLEYENEIEVTKGQSYLVYLFVKNTGYGNKSLKNVMFFAKLTGIPFDITPNKIDKISVDKSGMFLITFNVPYRIDTGTYSMEFTVKSDERERGGKINIHVKDLDIKELVERIIENYLYIIQKTKQQIEEVSADGKNVTLANWYLNKAEEELESAQQLYNIEEYEKAKDRLDVVRENLEMSIYELAMATIPMVPFLLPGYISTILIILISAAVAFVINFWYLRKRQKEKMIKKI
ncbi:MAG: hypothetical protein JSW41_05255, partial [Candidatus Aenigmatarchaeota archaeon]